MESDKGLAEELTKMWLEKLVHIWINTKLLNHPFLCALSTQLNSADLHVVLCCKHVLHISLIKSTHFHKHKSTN